MSTTAPLLYVGRRHSVDGKLGHFYQVEGTERLIGYRKPLTTGTKIGARVEAVFDDEQLHRVFSSGADAPRVVGYLDESDERLTAWAIEDKTASVEHSRRLEADRIAKTGKDPLLQYLEPVRAELARLAGDRQAAAVAWIMTYLLTGRRGR